MLLPCPVCRSLAPGSRFSQPLSCASPPALVCPLVSSAPLCVSLPALLAPQRSCLCGRKPPTFQSLDPALGLPTPPSFHFPELASALSFLLPGQELRWSGRGWSWLSKGSRGWQAHALERNPLGPGWQWLGLQPCSFLPLLAIPEEAGRTLGLTKVVITLQPPLPTHPDGRDSSTTLRLGGTSCALEGPPLPSQPLSKDASGCESMSARGDMCGHV